MTLPLRRLVKIFFQLVVVMIFGGPSPLQAQQTSLSRVFIDCIECDADYLRTQLTFVDLVRDRLLADVSAMITSLSTGSGGRSFTIEVSAMRGGRRADTTSVSVGPDATEVERREKLVRSLKIALLPFVRTDAITPYMDVTFTPPSASAKTAKSSRDPWNLWVFQVSGSGSVGSDDNYSSRGGEGSLSAVRVTNDLKIDISLKGSFNREKFRLEDGSMLTSDRHRWSARTLSVWSLNDHYSLGLTTLAGSSVFENTRFQLRAMPAIEYDFYPYREATRRQVIIRYAAGVRAARYVDTTIYHLIEETRPAHELSMMSDIRQQWGAVWSSAVWSQYLHDTGKRRLTLNAGIDWRIVAGLSLNFGVYYSRIRDQLNIPGTDLSNEERLLRLREIQSGYSFSGGLGLSYTFGSVFSNIVNSRFRL